MQIFFCVCVGLPMMRQPVQILFLILVTDLPPSIALGMEPGESNILKLCPRPKSEPIVLNWMWVSMVLNGAVLSMVIIGVYLGALSMYCDGEIMQDRIMQIENDQDKLSYARTVAFISLVWSENVRSYIARSFDQPVWRNLCGNSTMQKAVVMAQVCLYAAVLIPGFSDKVLVLDGRKIGWKGWLLALAGPVGTLILCELCKVITWLQMRSYQRSLAMQDDQESAQVSGLETQKQSKEGIQRAASDPPTDWNEAVSTVVPV